MTKTNESSSTDYLREPLWHARLAVVVAIILQITLPDQFVVGPKYLLPVLEAFLLVALFYTTPKQPVFRSILRRVNALTLIGLITLVNLYSIQQLVHGLFIGGAISNGHELILASINIYLTNIIIFSLWFWELDGGGHGARQEKLAHERDFLFPQMATPVLTPHNWTPNFIDYLYVSVTNASAFSPTDTMPLSRRAKLLMALQAFASLVTIALVAARAVNILS